MSSVRHFTSDIDRFNNTVGGFFDAHPNLTVRTFKMMKQCISYADTKSVFVFDADMESVTAFDYGPGYSCEISPGDPGFVKLPTLSDMAHLLIKSISVCTKDDEQPITWRDFTEAENISAAVWEVAGCFCHTLSKYEWFNLRSYYPETSFVFLVPEIGKGGYSLVEIEN